MNYYLLSTKQEVFPLGVQHEKVGIAPAGYERYLIPNPYGKHHLQIIRDDKVLKKGVK